MDSPPSELSFSDSTASTTGSVMVMSLAGPTPPPRTGLATATPLAETVPDGPEAFNNKLKRARKHVSCEGCRQRKVKCSRETVCANCRLRGQPCIWTDATPATASEEATLEEQLKEARDEIDRLRGEVARLTAEREVPAPPAPLENSSYSTPRPLPIPNYPLGSVPSYNLPPPSAHDAYSLAYHPFAHFAQQQQYRATYGSDRPAPPAMAPNAYYAPRASPPYGSLTSSSSSDYRTFPFAPYTITGYPPALPHQQQPSFVPAPAAFPGSALPDPTTLPTQRPFEPYVPAIASDPYYQSLPGAQQEQQQQQQQTVTAPQSYGYARATPASPTFSPSPQQHHHVSALEGVDDGASEYTTPSFLMPLANAAAWQQAQHAHARLHHHGAPPAPTSPTSKPAMMSAQGEQRGGEGAERRGA
ncbi:uncharacterized protein JCM10292_000414 [Rhodotorula paludigena]|uniref:uncharacterized protein n=1 Tax=Rhodotorula paludigena TaxID=86838 RepID=UPI0031784A03